MVSSSASYCSIKICLQIFKCPTKSVALSIKTSAGRKWSLILVLIEEIELRPEICLTTSSWQNLTIIGAGGSPGCPRLSRLSCGNQLNAMLCSLNLIIQLWPFRPQNEEDGDFSSLSPERDLRPHLCDLHTQLPTSISHFRGLGGKLWGLID